MELKNVKIRVKDANQCKQLQESLFKRGITWMSGTTLVKYLDSKFFYINDNKGMSRSSNDSDYFETSSYREVKVSDIIDNKFSKLKERLVGGK